MQNVVLWDKCLSKLEDEMEERDFHTWVRPLHASNSDSELVLYAPNRFIKDWLIDNLMLQLGATAQHFAGEKTTVTITLDPPIMPNIKVKTGRVSKRDDENATPSPFGTNVLNATFTFENHIEGKSNQIARAATKQVSENPGTAYNPLFIYGGVGLGKTHLMHAAGNLIRQNSEKAHVAYVHSERFVSDMVKSIETNSMNKFKNYYRSLDALLIDDIQFFADKDKSQEEFFSHI